MIRIIASLTVILRGGDTRARDEYLSARFFLMEAPIVNSVSLDERKKKYVIYLGLIFGNLSQRETHREHGVDEVGPDVRAERRAGTFAYERRRIRNPRNTSRRKVAFSCKSFCRSAWLPSTAFYYACVPYWQ